jgi:hypothetical protein
VETEQLKFWPEVSTRRGYVRLPYRDLTSRLKYLCSKARLRGTRIVEIDADYLQEIWDRQCGLCVYSGVPLTFEANRPHTVSLDRIDSSGDYVEGNVQLVCAVVNRMKMDMSEETFLAFCESITTNNRLRTT